MAAGLVQRVLLASPRGYCAGVERAVETVERALSLYGAPVYVRKQIVHNAHVVRDLEGRGAIFVEDETDAPPGAILVLSAHGVAPSVYERAAVRRQTTIDASAQTAAVLIVSILHTILTSCVNVVYSRRRCSYRSTTSDRRPRCSAVGVPTARAGARAGRDLGRGVRDRSRSGRSRARHGA